jgi:hypothetical protein
MYGHYIFGVDSGSVYVLLVLFILTRMIFFNCYLIIGIDRQRSIKLYFTNKSRGLLDTIHCRDQCLLAFCLCTSTSREICSSYGVVPDGYCLKAYDVM